MQTFLPYPDFQQSAAALDPARLGKQRVEALQTLRALVIPEYGWQSHPAIRMWMGYVPALTMYGLAMVDEWTKRGFADNTGANIREFAPQAAHPDYAAKIPMPPWLGDPELHLSHRSNLISKEPRFYTRCSRTPRRTSSTSGRSHGTSSCRKILTATFCGSARTRGRDRPGAARTKWGCRRWAVQPRRQSARERGGRLPAVYADTGSRRPLKVARKLPPKQQVKKPSRKRQRQEAAFSTLPGKSAVAIPLEGGSRFAVGMVLGAPITLDDGRFGRNFKVTEIIDRSAFDYPALLQDPRVFFPVPAL